MENQKSLFSIIKWKLVFAIILGSTLWVVSGALDFPTVFQIMFVCYAALGFVVFVLLDLPPMPEISGGKAVVAVTVFFLVVSAVFTAGGVYLPQYDPEWEKGKIAMIIMAKKRANPYVSNREIDEQASELMLRSDEISDRIAALEEMLTGVSTERAMGKSTRKMASPDDPVAYGKDVYDLYECYNCHKIGGKGGVKKRGPHMDNLGNVATAEDLKKKIFEPKSFMSEGFEKAFKKETMPDKYPDLMTDEELDALVAYLMTLKNPSVKTPRMIPQ